MSDKSDTPNLESNLEKCSDLVAIRISKLEGENEFLREQLEALKQKLRWQCKLANAYLQELTDTKDELRHIKHELSTVLMSQKLELNEAKQLAKKILKSKKYANKSLAELLGAIYGSPVKPEELAQINKSSITTKSLKGAECNRSVAKSKELRAESKELYVRYNENGMRFVSFKARFIGQSRFRAEIGVKNNAPTNQLESNYFSYVPSEHSNDIHAESESHSHKLQEHVEKSKEHLEKTR